MLDLLNGIRSIVETCMAVKPKERFLILADHECGPVWLGQLAMHVISQMGAEAVLSIIAPREIAGQEPPAAMAAAWKSVDAVLQISDRQGMTHTNARKDGTTAGVRYYAMIQVSMDEIRRGISSEDVRLIKQRTERLAQMLTEAGQARLTTPSGTDITMNLSGRKGAALHPLHPLVAPVPNYAEAAIAPVEGTAEGRIVVDLAAIGWGRLFREPLRLTVKAGKLVDLSGDSQDVARLRQIAATDENSGNFAELGIGSSHVMPAAMLGSRRDAARLGTVHVAIGRNNDIGGSTWSHIHLDFLMSQPTIELDGQCVMREGTLRI